MADDINDEVIVEGLEPEVKPQETPPEDKKKEGVLSDIDKATYEALSPEERTMLNDGEAKITDGEFRVSLGAFKKRIGGLQSRLREEQRRAEDLEAAVNTVRQQREKVIATDPYDDGITDEKLQELLDTGDVRRYGEIIAARTYQAMRKKEAEHETNAFQQQTWAKLIADGDERAMRKFPQLKKDSPEYDESFYVKVTQEAVKKGYLTWDGKKVGYVNPAAYLLAASDLAESGELPKKPVQKVDTQKQADLDEVMRQKRLKQAEMDKGKSKPNNGPTIKLTAQQKAICQKFGITPESYIKNLKRTEVTA